MGRNKKNVSLKQLTFRYWLELFLATLTLVLSALSSVIFAFFLARIINAAIELDIEAFKKGVIGAVAIISFGGLMEFIGHNFRKRYAMKTIIDYKALIIEKVMGYGFKQFLKENQTYYLNILTEEANSIQRHYYLQFAALLQNAAQIILGFAAMIYINWKFAIFVSLLFLLPMIVPGVVGPMLSKRMKQASKENEKYIISLKGVLEGFEVVKTYNLTQKIQSQFNGSTKDLEDSQYKVSKVDNAKDALAVFTSFLVQMGAISIGVYFVFRGQMEIGLLFGAIQIINGIVNPMTSLAQRIAWIAGTKSIRDKHNGLICLDENKNTDGENIDCINEIITENLEFGYDEENIIHNLNLQLMKGKKYAIIGSSGSGKSTLMKLLMGYYDEYQGRILINNKELRDIKKENYYEHISMIHQNVFLFEDTFENNIKLYRDVPQIEYEKAIEKTNLIEVAEHIGQKPVQILKDGGAELSGGERQRVAIARNLLLKTDFLLLDEAASALDPKNAEILYNTIFALDEVTCLVITHNWDDELLNNFDEVIQMDRGAIINQGKWSEINQGKSINNSKEIA